MTVLIPGEAMKRQGSGGVVVESVRGGMLCGPPPAIQVLVSIVSGPQLLFHKISQRSKILI
jgi:hypothetical protein